MELIRHRISEHKVLAVVVATAAALLVGFLFFANNVESHTTPGGCGTNGLSTSMGVSPTGTRMDGDVLSYTITFSNTVSGSCDITGLNATSTLPNGTTITVLSGASLPATDTITCPGDAECVTSGPYSYTVAHADETGPIGITCPPVPTGTFPRRVTAYTQSNGVLHSVDGEDSTGECKTISSIVKHDPTIVTEVHDSLHNDITATTTLPVGTAVHDEATVSDPGGFGTPSGDVNFQLFDNDTCNGSVLASTTIALISGAAETTATSTLDAGGYSYLAHYLGNGNFNEAVAQCEPFALVKLDSQTVTEVHDPNHTDITNSSVPVGTAVHDKATTTPATSGPTLTGNITFQLFDNGSCSGQQPIETEIIALSLTGTAESTATSTLAFGSYSYLATYGGDENYNGSVAQCEPFEIHKLRAEIATQVHKPPHVDITNSSVPLGTAVHDQATVSGTGPTPTGTVTFSLYNSNDCLTNLLEVEGPVVLVAGVAESTATSTLAVGDYGYLVSYSGDPNYNDTSGICEPFDVTQEVARIVTEVHDPAHNNITATSTPFGTPVHDKAIVSGTGPAPTGNVTFNLIFGLNCNGSVIETEIVALSLVGSDIVAESTATSTLAVGNYGYLVSYDGDQVYEGVRAECEPFEIEKLDSRVETEVHDGSHNNITNTTLPAGSTVHDKTTVFGIGPIPTGSVTFNLFTASGCSGQASTTEVVVLDAGGVAESSTTTALAIGNYGYAVSYGGDQVYNPSDGVCEPFEIGGPTRTQGFWQTHFDFAEDTFLGEPASYWEICPAGRDIDDMAELTGGFWSSIPYKSNGITKRVKTDQARMQLIQQLLAAMLNKAAFGTDDGGEIAAGKTAYCGTDRAAMLTAAGDLGAYNSSGDAIPSPVPTGPADPQTSQSTADETLWNTLP